MEEDGQQRKLDRLKLIRQGHRGVLTKLIREVETLLESHEPEVDRLKIICEQLDGKLKVFTSLDGEILELCPEDDIEWEIEESEATTAKFIGVKRKINLALKSPQEVPPVMPPTVDAAVASKPN